MDKKDTSLTDQQEFENVIISRLKEYSLATFERSFNNEKDGLRPVVRRVLYTLYKLKLFNTFKKVQYISGAVMEFHPYNGDTIADSMVLMGQWFSTSYPYLDRQGNFGTVKDIGEYSAPRYIEAKLSNFARDCITDDIDNHCITYKENYDNTTLEPEYLPTKVPLTLVQRSWGIGEAFVNGIPPYNLNDVVDCCIKVIKNKNIPLKELMKGVYPDYPTGGIITNKSELDYFQSLSASEVEKLSREGKTFTIKYRGKCNINREKNIIEITELPDRVDFNTIYYKILDEVRERNNIILSGIINVGDRLDNNPDKPENIIFELICKKDANLPEILNQLYSKTQLSTSQTLSFILYCGEYLKRMSFKDIILSWYNTQYDIKRRKYNYLLTDIRNKLHVLEGLMLIYDKMDSIIDTIRKSQNKEDAIKSLVKKFGLSQIQSKGICEMPLSSLSKVSKTTLNKDIETCLGKIKEYENNLLNIDEIIIKDLLYMKNKYGRPRRTIVMDLKEEMNTKTSINISNGGLLYSRDSVGIFDSTALSNGKTILNSMKPVKVNGKNTKEIIGVHEVKKDISGIIIFTKDGFAKRLKISDVPITNNWIIVSDTEISSAVPIYDKEEDSYIIAINTDYKIRAFCVNEINKQKVNVGNILSTRLISKSDINNSKILISNEYGEYIYIDFDEIPKLSRSSQGNLTGFISGDKFNIDIINKNNFDTILLFAEDELGVYYTAISESILINGKRTNKPKNLIKLKHMKYLNCSVMNNKIKNDSNIILIGQYNTSMIKGKYIKDSMDFKKINIKPIKTIQV